MEHDVAPPYYYRALLPVYIALDNAPILWHAIGLIWFAMTCYGPKSEFADVIHVKAFGACFLLEISAEQGSRGL
jgi:hypothetical protein